jgi:hypothetical protein
MSNTDTDFINLDENPVYANQISEFIQCLNLSCLRFQRPQLYVIIIFVPVLFVHRLYHRDNKKRPVTRAPAKRGSILVGFLLIRVEASNTAGRVP